MVVHDRGYKRWAGDREGRVPAARVIFERGVRTGTAQLFRRKFVAQLLSLVAYGPFLFALGFMYLFYFFSANTGEFGDSAQQMRESDVFLMVTPSPDTVWGYLFVVQVLVTLVLCVLVGTQQIAEDRRTNALELYFCRPLSSGQYLLGKLGVVAFFLSLVTVAPACLLVVAQMLLGGAHDDRLGELFDLLWRTAAAGAFLVLFVGLLVLTASSLCKRARHATILGAAVLGGLEFLVAVPLQESFHDPTLNLLSLSFDVRLVGAWILQNEAELPPEVPVARAAWVLLGWVVLCLVVLRRRLRPVEVVA